MGSGKKKGASEVSVPSTGLINPHDYIDQSDYRITKRGKAAYAEDLASLQYLAEMRQQEFQNEYNSPSEQSKRLREAGLNPDLLGLQGEPSSGVESSGINPMEDLPTNGETSSQIMSVINDAFAVGIATINGSMQFKSNLEALDLTNFEVADAAFDLTKELASMVDHKFDGKSYDGNTINASISSSPYGFLNRRNQKRTKAMSATVFESPQAAAAYWEARERASKAKMSTAYMESDPRYSSDFDEMVGCMEPFAKASADFMKKDLVQKMAHADDDIQYYQKRQELDIPGLKAQNEKEAFEDATDQYSLNKDDRNFRRDQLKMLAQMKKPLFDTIDKLAHKAAQGKAWATTCLISMYFGMNYIGFGEK